MMPSMHFKASGASRLGGGGGGGGGGAVSALAVGLPDG